MHDARRCAEVPRRRGTVVRLQGCRGESSCPCWSDRGGQSCPPWVGNLRAAGVSRHALAGAIGAGGLVGDGWGPYALPGVHSDVVAAVRLNGFLSHESAAAFWRLDVRRPPQEPCVVVPDDRRVPRPHRGVRIVERERLEGTEN